MIPNDQNYIFIKSKSNIDIRTLTSNLFHLRLVNLYICIVFKTDTFPNILISLACSGDRSKYRSNKSDIFKNSFLVYIRHTRL